MGAALLAATTLNETPPAILRVAKYSLRKRMERACQTAESDGLRLALENTIASMRALEPNARELDIAAELEQQATILGLEFDVGESQLIAMLLERGAELLISGDKRAIRALEQIEQDSVGRRIACLEQLIATMVSKFGLEMLRKNVCAAMQVDRALTAAFSCSSKDFGAGTLMEGLESYIADLRKASPSVLISNSDLSPIIS